MPPAHRAWRNGDTVPLDVFDPPREAVRGRERVGAELYDERARHGQGDSAGSSFVVPAHDAPLRRGSQRSLERTAKENGNSARAAG